MRIALSLDYLQPPGPQLARQCKFGFVHPGPAMSGWEAAPRRGALMMSQMMTSVTAKPHHCTA